MFSFLCKNTEIVQFWGSVGCSGENPTIWDHCRSETSRLTQWLLGPNITPLHSSIWEKKYLVFHICLILLFELRCSNIVYVERLFGLPFVMEEAQLWLLKFSSVVKICCPSYTLLQDLDHYNFRFVINKKILLIFYVSV